MFFNNPLIRFNYIIIETCVSKWVISIGWHNTNVIILIKKEYDYQWYNYPTEFKWKRFRQLSYQMAFNNIHHIYLIVIASLSCAIMTRYETI